MDNGWIKLHRKLLENPIANKPNYFTLWVTLLLKANHKETKSMWNGEVIVIKEGQILTGRKELSKQTGIPETTIERILKTLENGHQIGQQKTTKFRLITVINWKEFQNVDIKVDNKRTTNGHKQECKNDKNNTIATTSVANEPFDSDEYIASMRDNQSPHIRLLGWYFKKRGSVFPDEKTIKAEIKRWVKDASFIVKFGNDKIISTHAWVERKYPEEWNLSTIRKFITEK